MLLLLINKIKEMLKRNEADEKEIGGEIPSNGILRGRCDFADDKQRQFDGNLTDRRVKYEPKRKHSRRNDAENLALALEFEMSPMNVTVK